MPGENAARLNGEEETEEESNKSKTRSSSQSPEEILGESGLLKQLSKRLIERALAGELKAHLKG